MGGDAERYRTFPEGAGGAGATADGTEGDGGAGRTGRTGGTGGYAAARERLLRGGSALAAAGAPRRAALARLTDDWLTGLLGDAGPGVALVAVGGYGRGELSPRSDLDLLLLHEGGAAGRGGGGIAGVADRVWYPVWDLGIALDHSVRTLAEVRAVARDDLKVQLGLIDARHIAGDGTLTARLRAEVLGQWRKHAAARLPELRELAAERARAHGELRFLLEPDLKEARGGLRDATALRAVAASWLADAPRDGLAAAREALLDVRDALHLATGRATERLAQQDQGQVATALGLADADALLQHVYESARTIEYAADVTWREVSRVLRARDGRPSRLRGLLKGAGSGAARTRAAREQERTPLAEGVVEHDGEAALARAARPGSDPVLPLRAAAAAAQAQLPLALPAVRRLATAPALPVPWPAEAREEFVTLLGAGEATVPVWEALDAEGLIGRLLPDWERVRCRPQRNPVHRFTVDRHLVETAVRASALTRRVERPDLLLVGALLHDIGKGWQGDHSIVGETVAYDTALRMGFGTHDAEVLARLVRHHLLLVDTATRRDLDDPSTIRSVADAVGSRSTLELLHALTEADALATGPAAWSAWRAALVEDLAGRVAGVLAGEAAEEQTEPFVPSAEAERLAVESWRTRAPALALSAHAGPGAGADSGAVFGTDSGADGASVGVELLVAVPAGPASDCARAGAWPGADTGVRAGASAGADPGPVSRAPIADVPIPDSPTSGEPGPYAPGPYARGALPAVAGVLALHRLTVRAADLRVLRLPDMAAGPGGASAGGGDTDKAGVTPATCEEAAVLLLSWRVAAEFGPLPTAERLRADVARALDGSLDLAARLAEREAAYRSRRRRSTAAPPRVTVAHGGSRSATVLEVRAQDAPGLLYRIGGALEGAGVLVRSAHVSTLGANAVDAFYLTDADGGPLSPAGAAALARGLERELARGGAEQDEPSA